MAGEEKKQDAAKAGEAPKEQPSKNKAPVEKQTNCLTCNKPIKKLKCYYRNGKYYCSKRCWKKATAPKETK